MLFILIAIFACDNNIVEQLLGIPLFLAIAMSLIRTLLTSFLGRTHKNVWFRSPDRLTTLSEKSPDFEVEWSAFSLLGPAIFNPHRYMPKMYLLLFIISLFILG